MCIYLSVCLYLNNTNVSLYMCMYMYVLFVYACIVCIFVISLQYQSVLCVFAQTSIQAAVASSNDPPLGRQPAGPTRGDPGQLSDHFTPPSGTHSPTRFGAPARASRVGRG